MNKILYPIVNQLVNDRTKAHSGTKNMREVQLDIRRHIPKKSRKNVSTNDVYWAAQIIIKRLQESPTNCVITKSTRNYYNAVPTEFDMNECGKYKIRRIPVK